MENVRNDLDFELVNTPERFQKCVNSPTYRHRHIITENLVGEQKEKEHNKEYAMREIDCLNITYKF